MHKFSRPSLVLISAAILLLLGTGIFAGDASIDIIQHDTYFVVSIFHFCLPIVLLLLLFERIYHWLRNFRLVRWFTWIHITITCATILTMFLPIPSTAEIDHKPYTYESYRASAQFIDLTRRELLVSVVCLAFVLAQFLFFANIIAGFIRGRKRQT